MHINVVKYIACGTKTFDLILRALALEFFLEFLLDFKWCGGERIFGLFYMEFFVRPKKKKRASWCARRQGGCRWIFKPFFFFFPFSLLSTPKNMTNPSPKITQTIANENALIIIREFLWCWSILMFFYSIYL